MAQTTYSEGNDFPSISGAASYVLSQAGDYTFSGTVQTPNDQQDAVKVIIPTGFKITKAVLQASGGASQQQPSGFVAFADGYSGYSAASFSSSDGVNVTRSGDLGPNSASNPYIGLASVDYSVGTSWSIRVTVVSTGGENTCTNPTVPTISATRTAICAGSNTTLSIQTGSLNDATAWKWYSGSCGGTLVGTGSSIQVSPGSTTTYYVRGEGGCVTPGSCASQQITVSSPFTSNLTNDGPLTCAKTRVTLITTGGPTGATYTYSGGAQANSANLSTATVSQAGPYSVTVTAPGGCSATATTIVSSNTLAPNVSVSPTAQTICQGQTAIFTAQGASTYSWSNGQSTANLSVSETGTYSVTGVAANGCRATATATLTVKLTPTLSFDAGRTASSGRCDTPNGQVGFTTNLADGSYSFSYRKDAGSFQTVSLVVTNGQLALTGLSGGRYYGFSLTSNGCTGTSNATVDLSNPTPPSVSISPTAQTICQGQSATFTAQGADAYQWSTGATTASISVSVAGPYSVTGTNSNGCSATASATLSVTPLPAAPTLVTQNGYPYSAGVSSLTISQNTGPVRLIASGCNDGQLLANGSPASSFTISTANSGTQTYTATCTQNGCTSPAASFVLTVVPTTLSVLYRDADYGNTGNNIIKPFLKLANAGGQSIPYGEVTVRYWFTSEGNSLPTNLAVYYAQLGAVSTKYVALAQPRQGALGYVEYSFPGGGSLPANGNSGPIENGIQKTDGSNFNESDDYSYQANYADYIPNVRVTAYRNGTIVWGQEPTAVASQTAVQVYSQAKDGTTTSQIQTRVELRNTGNVALAVSSLKLRYYFTSDNGQTANVFVDYADIGASNVQARVVRLPSPVNGADSYVELSFAGNSMQVNALSSLGVIDFRLVRSDNGLFDQNNDYSYGANYGTVGLNNRITAYLNNQLIYGTPPSGAPARVGVLESTARLQTRLLGNPVVGNRAEVEITGVAGQAVNLKLVDLQGRAIHEQRIEQASTTEHVSLPLGSSQGQLLLRVSTDTQQQSLKLLRP
ncbi:hypothetical protein GCM10028816_44470 [Spirosoma lituiforme]